MEAVTIISRDPAFQEMASRILQDHFRTVSFSDLKPASDYIYNDTPSLVVVDIPKGDDATISFINLIKEDPLFSRLPILVVFDGDIDPRGWENILCEDYLRNNEIFALAYADLDNFKPFNDRYGFGRGDELIRMTGRIILNTVKESQSQGFFVGHIGGDDFVVIMKPDLIEKAAENIIERFDTMIAGFYDTADWDAGYIFAADRKGVWSKLPVTSISIGITDTERRAFSHHGELMQRASEMKSYAKKFAGSCCKMDQREKKTNPA